MPQRLSEVPVSSGFNGGRASARSTTGRLQRRRQALAAMAVLAVVTILLAVVASQPWWTVHLITDAMLIGYVAFLIHVRNAAADSEMTHRALSR